MGYENVKLWFAKDEKENIITIDDVKDTHNTYSCPICGSPLLPKATNSKKITPHFAHIDASKCGGEHYIHWWFKNRLIEPGDEFKVVSDKERLYKCKEILVEHPYPTSFGEYRPDVTVITETGETIYFEMAFSNKKKIKDYLDMWLELKNTVIEIDINQMLDMKVLPSFKALFYDGKCFHTKRNDTYYNTIGKYKEQLMKTTIDNETQERIKKLDWFWKDVMKYNRSQLSDDYMINLIESFEYNERIIVDQILKRTVCSKLNDVYKNYLRLNSTHFYDNPVTPDSPLKKAIKKLNREYRKISKDYSVYIERESNRYKAHRWFRGRKQGYWVTESYYYTVYFRFNQSDFSIVRLPVTNQVAEMNSEEAIYLYYKDKLKQR